MPLHHPLAAHTAATRPCIDHMHVSLRRIRCKWLLAWHGLTHKVECWQVKLRCIVPGCCIPRLNFGSAGDG